MSTVKFDVVDDKYLPKKATSGSACFDLRARLDEQIELKSGERKLIMTGLKLGLELGSWAEVRSRSGLAIKNGIMVLNSPGTVDSDYKLEVGVILYNTDKFSFKINDGDKIAQLLIVSKDDDIRIIDKDGNDITCQVTTEVARDGGFGSTGIR